MSCALVLLAMSFNGGRRRIQAYQSQKVCRYWREGRCNRNPCPFLHSELPDNNKTASKLPSHSKNALKKNVSAFQATAGNKQNANFSYNQHFSPKYVREPSTHVNSNQPCPAKWIPGKEVGGKSNQHCSRKWVREDDKGRDLITHVNSVRQCSAKQMPCEENPNARVKYSDQLSSHCARANEASKAPQKIQDKCCENWMLGKCTYEDNCRYQHQWSIGDGFSQVIELSGHDKDVSAIVLPLDSDKLFSGSKDGTLCIWDCNTGKCGSVFKMGAEIGCMISEGPWLFVGGPNVIKAMNSQTGADLILSGTFGQIHSLKVGNDMLFAGTQDGTILAWKYSDSIKSFELAASLKGHNLAVVSLFVGAGKMLYSASMDHTIRVWDLETLQCIEVLTEHTDAVTCVIGFDRCLLSCSLDQTIKVWFRTESGSLEAIYTHNVDHGLRLLHGGHDGDGRPVLMCSCNDKTMRLYDLPSFEERGRIFSVEEIQAVDILDRSMFFTGDGTGKIRWRKFTLLKPSSENCSSLAMECGCGFAVSKDQKEDADDF
ncbi:hypothetical protein Syun_017386 [Stephania yunnanensis]|uniref:C3H1-type domain-containing protein n=1 Tax=Stephania yunnanensis TaxID=152371 RepID=A0AAP0P3B5_9MAGN